jgi:predicted adenine nucleotide alpha hydrolase (AANH) superfamily ATPase
MQKFLLHTCCAPCSIAIIDELKNQFDLTVFFYNPNIYPEEEYLKRKKEVVRVCEEWGVKMIDLDYNEKDLWNTAVLGFENEKEGGVRCAICLRFRLAKTAEYANQNGFPHWGTSLTSGRNKSAEVIGAIGLAFGNIYKKTKFYNVDWKKGGRLEKASKMVKDRLIYRQNYCGCKYSLKQKNTRPTA